MTARSTLILVAGGPGAGKTSFGRALARAIPSAVLVDKDVLASPWLDPVLARLNDGAVDRDSRVYWETLRPLEYASLMAVAYDNVAIGKTAIVIAPFGPELRDREWIEACHSHAATLDTRLVVIWMAIGADAARERIARRNDARDGWKLAHWREFSAGDPYSAPVPGRIAPGDWLVLHNDHPARIDDLVERALRSASLR